jgi:hypothetical protein
MFSRKLSTGIRIDGVPTTACHLKSLSNVHHLLYNPHYKIIKCLSDTFIIVLIMRALLVFFNQSLPFDVAQNAEHILLLYVGIYEPYGDADKEAEGIALC